MLMTVALDMFESDDDPQSARPIALNAASQAHTIHVGADVDWVRFAIAKSSLVVVETAGESGDTILRLYGPGSATNQLDSNDDGGVGAFSRIERQLNPGTYYAQVTEYGQDSSIASYSLKVTSTVLVLDSFEADNTAQTAKPISLNATAQNHSLHHGGDEDWVKFEVTQASLVVMETAGLAGDTKIDLYGSNGTQRLDSDDDSGAGSFSRLERPLAAGTYFVRVTEYGQDAPILNYSLRVTAVPVADLVVSAASLATAGQLPLGGDVTVNWTGQNSGLGTTGSTSWSDRIYFSADATLGNDQWLATEYLSGTLAVGETYSRSKTVTLPADLAWAGRSGYLIVVTDDDDSVTEANNGNNTLAIPIRFAAHIEVVSPFANQFVDLTNAVTFQWRAIDGTGTSTVRLAVDSDANPNNGVGHQWITTTQTLRATADNQLQSVIARLPQLAARTQPYYVWAQLTNADGTRFSTPIAVTLMDRVSTSIDDTGEARGGDSYEVFGIEAAQSGSVLTFRVRTNYNPQKPYEGNSSGGGDFLVNVGGQRFGLAVNTHRTTGGEVVAGDLYKGTTFLGGTLISSVPTFIQSYSQRISGRSTVQTREVTGLPWRYEVLGTVDVGALVSQVGATVSASWAMYCGNDTDDVSIQPQSPAPPPLPDLIAKTLASNNAGGMAFSYDIAGAILPAAATAAVYWADGSGRLLGNAVFTQSTATAIGSYGPVEVQGANLDVRPAGATQLILVLDQANGLSESNESNNTVATTNIDPDDQISEAIVLGPITNTVPRLGQIDVATDVDMYSFTVNTRDKIAFDIDDPAPRPNTAYLDGAIRLFDASGRQLQMNSGGQSPRDGTAARGYLEYTFANPGTYYVGISGRANANYNAKSGAGDSAAKQGQYKLILTPILRTTSPNAPTNPLRLASTNQIEGQLMLPDPSQHQASIPVTLQRVNDQGSATAAGDIVAEKPTWIVIHGRIDTRESFRGLAGDLVRTLGSGSAYHPGDVQVLLLDWSEGARDNHLVLDGAAWVPLVGEWAASVLRRVGANGVAANELHLVGHSWGSYVAYEIGKQFGTVRGIVALDPAQEGLEYADSAVNFRSVSRLSWAFFGSGLYGSAILSSTAHESFYLEYDMSLPQINPLARWLAQHTAPINVFQMLVRQNFGGDNGYFSGLFSLDRFRTSNSRTDWVRNWFAQGNTVEVPLRVFEGYFWATEVNGSWIPLQFRYRDPRGFERTVL